MKCPRCKSEVFTATGEQLIARSCFSTVVLHCANCDDVLVHEVFIQAESRNGRRLKFTKDDEIRDYIQLFRAWLERVRRDGLSVKVFKALSLM